MTVIPWGILALLIAGFGMLFLIATAKKEQGRLIERNKQSASVISDAAKAHDAENTVAAAPPGARRKWLRDFSSQ